MLIDRITHREDQQDDEIQQNVNFIQLIFVGNLGVNALLYFLDLGLDEMIQQYRHLGQLRKGLRQWKTSRGC